MTFRAPQWLTLAALVTATGAAARAQPAGAGAPCVASGAALESARLTADALELCFVGAPGSCWRLTLAARSLAALPPGPPPGRAPEATAAPATATTLATTIRVCAPDGADCRQVDVPGVAAIGPRDVVVNGDLSRIAVLGASPATPGSGGPGRPLLLFDAGAGRLVATIRPWKTPMGDPAVFQGARFVGDALYVMISYSPVSSAGRLYEGRTGRRLAEVGGRARDLDDSTEVDLGSGRWAFVAFGGGELFVHDVATGRRLASIPTAPPGTLGGAATPGVAFLGRTGDGRTLVAVRGEARSGVTLVELATLRPTYVAVPACR